MTVMGTIWIILKKDLLVELRTRDVLVTMGLFALLIVVIFAFAFTIDRDATSLIAPGILWVTLVFAGNLGVARAFAHERDNDCLTALMLAPGGPIAVFWAKALGIMLFMWLIELLIVPIALMLLGITLPLSGLPTLVLALLLGSLGFALVGTLFGAMLGHARLREVLVPLIVYPVVIPVLVAGVKLSAIAFDPQSTDDPMRWLPLMIGFDIVFAVVAPWVFARVMVD